MKLFSPKFWPSAALCLSAATATLGVGAEPLSSLSDASVRREGAGTVVDTTGTAKLKASFQMAHSRPVQGQRTASGKRHSVS